jgi:hypothetical protein
MVSCTGTQVAAQVGAFFEEEAFTPLGSWREREREREREGERERERERGRERITFLVAHPGLKLP